jgi:hypothetical protein
MSGFSSGWLALREPFDRRARSTAVLDAVAAWSAGKDSIAVVDLACGLGSTLRTVSGRLPRRQSWRLVDNDLSLLARAADLARPPDLSVLPVPVDLARDLEAALDGPIDLITTSALLDLVSHDWLDRLVTETAARRLPIYAALSYDGLATLDPVDPMDCAVIDAVNQHQRGDKGFGPALGPEAAAAAPGRFESVGYTVVQGASDWVFGSRDTEIQTEVLTGWAVAAREIGNSSISDVIAWLARRRDHIAAGRSSMRVGHVDFFAHPTTTR